jgi:adenylate kinase family enzyme
MASTKAANKDIVFVLGGPGTGKGTVCAKLSQEFSMPHLSMGDLLRAEVKRGSELGARIHAIIDGGNIVPAAITVELLLAAIARERSEATAANKPIRGVLVDGFPRSMEQVGAWEDGVGGFGFVLYLACKDEEVLVRRMLKRGESGESERTDDDEPTIRKRLAVNREQCEPCVEHYRGRADCTVHEVNADQSPEDEVAECRKLIAAHFAANKL